MVAENGRDELAVLLEHHSIGVPFHDALADAILSSSWLAGQLKQARADALEEAAAQRKRAMENQDWDFDNASEEDILTHFHAANPWNK
ncbi:hypothetical protein [Rathayibacter sp. VKM Ac-2630]|uniref:hypothetical protein n=1 Tax=Rathayibacter sp. VKM Ac-2630 TaxID=1938617 RepID=UPI0009821B07|nr:hypothetical protein [Rathayibacter sp. VKM Ac-2630]OOB91205.1 hypothetical protein B0T42_07350 [Rathayibacter sp. VKM Ac-2630]